MDTKRIREDIENLNSLDDLRQYFELNNKIYDQNRYKEELKNLKRAEIVSGMEVGESTAQRIKNSIPFKRENAIMAACLLGKNGDETDNFLKECCRFSKLYAKNLDDFIWLFILNHGGSKTPAKDFQRYKSVAEALINNYNDNKKNIANYSNNERKILDTLIVKNFSHKKKFVDAIKLAIPNFSSALVKFKSFFNEYTGGSGYLGLTNVETNSTFANLHYKSRDELAKGIMPSRIYLLCLSFNLDKTVDETNELLEAAGYAPFDVTDKLEALLYFTLHDATQHLPEFFGLLGIDDPKYLKELENRSEDLIITFADIARLVLSENKVDNSEESIKRRKRMINYLRF